MKTLIYDCEIIKCIPPRQGRKDPLLQYCNGWRDFKNMGISLIGCWISWKNQIKIFPKKAFEDFQKLVDVSENIVSFNGLAFDDKLCAANGINIETNYDLLIEAWAAAGLPRVYTPGVTVRGYSLDSLCHYNFGYGKSGNGALAPVLWQNGQKFEVVKYLTDDVLLTRKLWLNRHNLKDPVNDRDLVLA